MVLGLAEEVEEGHHPPPHSPRPRPRTIPRPESRATQALAKEILGARQLTADLSASRIPWSASKVSCWISSDGSSTVLCRHRRIWVSTRLVHTVTRREKRLIVGTSTPASAAPAQMLFAESTRDGDTYRQANFALVRAHFEPGHPGHAHAFQVGLLVEPLHGSDHFWLRTLVSLKIQIGILGASGREGIRITKFSSEVVT